MVAAVSGIIKPGRGLAAKAGPGEHTTS